MERVRPASAEFTPVDKTPLQDLEETGRKQQNALFIFNFV